MQTAVDAELPLLLSTAAAGQLKDTVGVGRMKGRPGMLTITTSGETSDKKSTRLFDTRTGGDRLAFLTYEVVREA